MNKLVLIAVFLLATSTLLFAGMPTEEQVEMYCVQVVLKIDNDVHNFYIGNIESFNEKGFTVLHGRYREKRAFYPREVILNYEEALAKYKKLKGALR